MRPTLNKRNNPPDSDLVRSGLGLMTTRWKTSHRD